jgi:flavin-binding protein dodecin
MAENDTYRLTEIAGTSPEGITEAINAGIARVGKTVRGLDWFEVTGIRGHIEDGVVKHFQVQLKVGFKVEE